MKDFVNWFEIPVHDIHRAVRFYSAIYGQEMEMALSGEFAMAYFPADKGIGGALIQGPGCYPSDAGVLIYLNAGGDMDGILGRIDLAGGRIIMPKTLIGERSGHFALFIDSEGNRLALHERPEADGPRAERKKPAKKAAASRKKAAAKRARRG